MNEADPSTVKKKTIGQKFVDALLGRTDKDVDSEGIRPCTYSELLRFASNSDRRQLYAGILMSMLVGMLMPINVVLSGLIANDLLETDQIEGNDALRSEVTKYLYGYIVCGILIFIFGFYQQHFLAMATARIISRMRNEFLAAVLRQDAEWLERKSAGEIACQLNENIDRVRDGLSEKLAIIVRGASQFVLTLVVGFVYNWMVALVMLGVGPIGAMIMACMNGINANPMRRSMDCHAKSSSLIEEVIMNAKTVMANNGEEEIVKKYSNTLEEGKRPFVFSTAISGIFEGAMFMEIYIFMAISIMVGVVATHTDPSFDRGSAIVTANTIAQGAYFLCLIGPHIMSLLKARISAAIIYKTIDRNTMHSEYRSAASEMSVDSLPDPDARLDGRIEFVDVSFKYSTRETPVLQRISWTAEKGKCVAFVGHSGSGKSTTVGLLTRLYDANDGRILVDGVDVKHVDPKNIGIVQQEPYLFNATIRDNIVLGRSWNGIVEDRVNEVLRMADAADFVEKLDKGIDTLVGDGGVRLSGGQKQRIAIARALFPDPPILILDEATSALDVRTETAVQRALNKASVGRTSIVIAHRLSTIQKADVIYVLDKGRIVEKGKHGELLQLDGIYASLAKTQSFHTQPAEDDFTPVHMSSDQLSRYSSRKKNNLVRRVSSEKLNTYALEFDAPQEKEKAKAKSTFLRMYSHGHFGKMASMIFFAILRGFEIPMYVLLFRFFYSALGMLTNAPDVAYRDELVKAMCFAIFIGTFIWIALSLSFFFSSLSAESVMAHIKTTILERILGQEVEYFDHKETSPAAIVSDINNQSTNLAAGLDGRCVLFIWCTSTFISSIALVLVLDWAIATTGVLTFAFFLLILIFLFVKQTRAAEIQHESDRTAELAVEMLEQTRTIQLLVAEKHFERIYADAQIVAEHHTRKISVYQSLMLGICHASVFVFGVLSFWIGIVRAYDGILSGDDLFSCGIGTEYLGWVLVFVYPAIPDLMRANTAARILYKYYDLPVNPEDSGSEKAPLIGSVALKNVTFAYPTRPNYKVADRLSLSASFGESIALVGPSGCGKSTIVALLERFYEQQSGVVEVDKHDHRTLNKKHLRNEIALVGQEPVLFEGSIAENVSLGCNASLDDIREACRQANAASFIEALPLGYDTNVGEKGRALSGGQKQRIAIARALVRKPKILLLDEATSALDAQSEKMIQDTLSTASNGRTSISIAHRMASIKEASCIYFIEGGYVVESGTHEELMHLEGHYSVYVHAQTLSGSVPLNTQQ